MLYPLSYEGWPGQLSGSLEGGGGYDALHSVVDAGGRVLRVRLAQGPVTL